MANNPNPSNSDLQFPSDPAGDIDHSLQPIDERIDSAALRFPSFDDAPTPKRETPHPRDAASAASAQSPTSPMPTATTSPAATSAAHTASASPQPAVPTTTAPAGTRAMPTFTFANSNTEAPTQAMPASGVAPLNADAASDDFNVPVWGAAEGSAAAADDEQTELFPPALTSTSVNTHTQQMAQDGATTATLPPINPRAGMDDAADGGTHVLVRTASSYTNTVIETNTEGAPASFEPLEEVADEDDGDGDVPDEPGNGHHGRDGGSSRNTKVIVAVVAALVVVALVVVGIVMWQRG